MKILTALFVSILITFSLPIIFMSIAHNQNPNINKMANFECGFNQMSPNRMTFSSQFFMIAILFLIFDLEISLILPLPMEENKMNLNIMSSLILILALTIGLVIEWKQGMLEWSK